MLGFYWLWLKTAFKHSFGPIDLWSGMAAAAVGLVTHFWPSEAEAMTSLTWQIPLWVLCFVMTARLLVAPYWIWKAQQEKVEGAEGELARLTGEYAHALALEQINNEETRETNKDGEVIGRHQGVGLVLRNTITRPLRYTVKALKVNGIEGENYQNRGAVISPLSRTMFYSSKQPAPLEAMDKYQQFEVELEIEYGPPAKALRVMRRSATLEVYPAGNVRFVTKGESEEPIEGE
jgi:hypothetical protein